MAIQDILSENKHRRYPFVEDSDIGSMPDWLLLDIRLVDASYSGEDATLLCKKARLVEDSFVITFEYHKDDAVTEFTVECTYGDDIIIGTVSVSDGCVVKYAVYGGGSEYRLDGDTLDSEFSAEILKSRLVLLDRRLFVKTIGGCSGTVHIVDGHNTTARTVNGVVNIKTGNGLGLGADCSQDENAFDCTKALLFINGQHADTQGNININGGPGVTVQTGRNALVNGSIVPAITIKANFKAGDLY